MSEMRYERRERGGLLWLAVLLSVALHVPLTLLYVHMLRASQPLADDSPIFVEYRPFEDPQEE